MSLQGILVARISTVRNACGLLPCLSKLWNLVSLAVLQHSCQNLLDLHASSSQDILGSWYRLNLASNGIERAS